MKNLVLGSLLLMLLVTACSNERETASGQKFKIIKKGDGKDVSSKSFLVMNFRFADGKDSSWNDTKNSPYPLIVQKSQINRPGDRVYEVFNMLTLGDSTVFDISAKDLFKYSFRQPIPPKVDSTSSFHFYVGVTKVLDSAGFMKFREDLIAKQNEIAEREAKEQLAKDTVAIDNYLKEKGVQAQRTRSGLRYVVTQKGQGENIKAGQTASVNYAGHLLNGKYFDTSIEAVAKRENLYQQGRPYAPIDVPVGQRAVISGWDEMLQLMNKGMKATVYIPSTLGYGKRGSGPVIRENAILVFDMEITKVK